MIFLSNQRRKLLGELLTLPEAACVAHVRSRLPVSERRACTVVGQPRATQRRRLKTSDDEAALTAAIVQLATRYGRYGYRRIREMLVPTAGGQRQARLSHLASGRAESALETSANRAVFRDSTMMGRACASDREHPNTTSRPSTSSRMRTEDRRAFRMLAAPRQRPARRVPGDPRCADASDRRSDVLRLPWPISLVTHGPTPSAFGSDDAPEFRTRMRERAGVGLGRIGVEYALRCETSGSTLRRTGYCEP